MVIKIINHKKIEIKNTKVKCKCGCGKLLWKFDKKNRERFYKTGHGIKVNINVWNKGKKNVYSIETLRKMRMAKIGTCFRKGKLASEMTKKNISNAKLNEWKDKKQSETLRKLKLKAKDMAKKIPLKDNCEICKSTNNLQRHHWRYDKPLLVNTLCKECHTIQHLKHFENSKYARKMEVIAQ